MLLSGAGPLGHQRGRPIRGHPSRRFSMFSQAPRTHMRPHGTRLGRLQPDARGSASGRRRCLDAFLLNSGEAGQPSFSVGLVSGPPS